MARLIWTACIIALTLLPTAAAASKRVALVIGNDAYANVTPLKKAVNDANTIGDTLAALGFRVSRALDVDRREMNRAIADFAASVEDGDTAMLFYAGHGVEIRGANYLLPVDIPDGSSEDGDFVMNEAMSLDTVLERLRARSPRLSLVILDACRNNPFSASGTRSLGGTGGLARIAAPKGTFVMYSADVGETALDRLDESDSNPNSVFTRTLVPMMRTPGVDLVDTARAVRLKVRDLAATVRHEQTPAYYDAVLGDFYFAGTTGPGGTGSDVAPPPRLEASLGPAEDIVTDTTPEPPRRARPTGRALVLTGGEKDSIRLWDAETARMIGELHGEKILPTAMRITGGGATVAVATREGQLLSYAVPSFEKLNTVDIGFRVSAIAETDSGMLVLGGADGRLAAVNPITFAVRWQSQTHDAIVSPILLSDDQKTALSASADGTVATTELESGQLVSRASTVRGKAITDLERVDATTAIITHEDGTVAYLDIRQGRVLAVFPGNKGWISSVGISPASDRFVTAGVDGTVSVWPMGSKTPSRILPAHTDVASGAKFIRLAGAETRMVSAGFDGYLKFWNGGGDRLLASAEHGSAIIYFDLLDAR